MVFLPEIHTYVEEWKANRNKVVDTKIVDGKLVCSLEKNTETLDLTYDVTFSFTENKLQRLVYSISTRGDINLDEQTLDEENTKCVTLKNETEKIKGVTVSCNYTEGLLKARQDFEYSEINVEEVDAAYSEAGGIYPEYKLNDDMDVIEKNMNASGYSCERQRK